MLDTTSRPDAASANLFDDKPSCEHCRQPFERRKGKGGEPQRFCSPECRRTFHSESEPHRAPPPPTPVAENPPAVPEQPKPKDAPATTVTDSDEFDWLNDDAVVIREQPETAIYFNPKGGLVIRQRNGWDDDVYVYINAPLIDTFVDKLCDIAGVASFPPRDRK